MVIHGPNDGLCCPTLKKLIRYELSGNQLKEAVEDEPASWKTYRNEKYGFELKYPNNYSLQTSGERKEGRLIYNLLVVDIYEESRTPLVTIRVTGPNFVLGTRDWEGFSLGEIDGIISYNWYDWKVRERVSSVEIIFTSENNQEFYIIAKGDPLKDKAINKILSTFRFLE